MLLKHFRNNDNYEKNYKLLEVGLDKIISVLSENGEILQRDGYSPAMGFPKVDSTIDAMALTLENTCLFAELLLHLPELSYKILAKHKQWRPLLNGSLEFARHFYASVVDATSQKLLSIFDQEINEAKRNADYVNPYYNKLGEKIVAKPKKAKKRLAKGPKLGGEL